MQLRSYLLPLYAVATLFPRLLALPAPFGQVQLTELLFPLLLWAFRGELLTSCRRFPLLTWSVAAYVSANLLSAIRAGDAGTLLEGAARGYLGAVAMLTVTHIRCYGWESLEHWWRAATVAVATAALGYYLLITAGYLPPDRGVLLYQSYPYLGDVLRLRATASTSGMWVMLLLPGALFALHRYTLRSSKDIPWALLLITVAMVPSWSKELLLLGAGGVLLYWPGRHRSMVVAGALVVVLLAGTHYLVVGPQYPDAPALQYRGQHTVERVAGYRVVETVYMPIKRIALRVGTAHPLLGVGPGNFFDHSQVSARPGELPPGFGRFDPHSTWLGAFAETGIPGLLTLLLLVGVIWCSGPEGVLGPVGILLLLFLVASVFKDVANFRGVWVLVGWWVGCRGTTRPSWGLSGRRWG